MPLSPLRYPGGKQVLSPLLSALIQENGLEECTYVEPYAGGAGAALTLLFSERVAEVVLNDKDPRIYAFWTSVLNKTDAFLEMLLKRPVTVAEWRRQKQIYEQPKRHSTLELGFATFFLNRTNRSGIIASGAPIGGHNQNGKWKINARFNRERLADRIEKIALFKKRIKLKNLDALQFMTAHLRRRHTNTFVYLDPPYFLQGHSLYLNHYRPQDHAVVASNIRHLKGVHWVMTYDRTTEIERLYAGLRQYNFSLGYSAFKARKGNELLILSSNLNLPRDWRKHLPMRSLFKTRVRDGQSKTHKK